MATNAVWFDNPSGESLAGLVQGASQQLVVLCHGYTDHKNSFHFPAMADALEAAGYSSLRFDFSGNGDSEGEFEFGNYAKEVEDIRSAINYARTSLSRQVVGLVGHSKGGNDVVLYAAKYDDIPLVINIAGRFQMQRGIAERFGQATIDEVLTAGQKEMTRRTKDGTTKWILTKRSLEERLHHTDMDAAAKSIHNSRVITIHGSNDQVIPVEDGHAFAGRIKQHQLQIIDGADHNFRNPEHGAQLVQAVAASFMASDSGE